MALFNSDEEVLGGKRLDIFMITPFNIEETHRVEEVTQYYKKNKREAYQFYAKQWREKRIDSFNEPEKESFFEIICASIIEAHQEAINLCKSDLKILNCRNIDEVINIHGLLDLDPLHSQIWTPSSIKLQAYVDRSLPYYEDGKLSDFEYILQATYRQKVIVRDIPPEEAYINFVRDTTIYRNAFFEGKMKSIPNNGFYLQLELVAENTDYSTNKHVQYQANEDSIYYTKENFNTNFLTILQTTFNRQLDNHAIDVKRSLLSKASKKQKQILNEAKINEDEIENRYRELFHLYFQTFFQTQNLYAVLTAGTKKTFDTPSLETYPLVKFFADVEDSFETTMHTSMDLRVQECTKHYKASGLDDCYLNTQNQIRSYYQDQLSQLIEKANLEARVDKEKLEKQELTYIEEYKQKINEFRNLCMHASTYKFKAEIPVLNRFSDYSFSIGSTFHGLDKRQTVELAVNAGQKKDLSLHNLEIIRLKTLEFINMNCMDGDRTASMEKVGTHEVNVVMEKFAMTEQRLLIFCESLCATYIKHLRRSFDGETDSEKWMTFENKVKTLMELPLSTYYDNKFEVSGVQKQAKIDKENYKVAENTPFFTKMRNASQQKIFDVNNHYGPQIELIKQEYIKTGERAKIKIIFEDLRVDIDRIVDEHFKLASYYKKEFDQKATPEDIQFEKGIHYDFQRKAN